MYQSAFRSALAISVGLFASASATAQTAPTFDWSGPYVGLNAGGVFNGKTKFDRTTGDLPNNTNALTTGLRPIENTIDDSGVTGGAQVGYNYGLGNFVVGAEADIAYTDLSRTETLSNTANIGPLGVPSTTPFTRVNQYRGKLDYLGTVRGRAGFAFDRVLVYGTGGLAYGRVTQETIYFGPNANDTPFFEGRNKKTRTGYVFGGGAEFALPTDSFLNVFGSSAVTLRAEYLHYDLGNQNLRFPGVNGGATIGGYDSRVQTRGDLVRAAISYKF
jgi:outer membrane immunogenic protein